MGSSLADVSDASGYESFGRFVGMNTQPCHFHRGEDGYQDTHDARNLRPGPFNTHRAHSARATAVLGRTPTDMSNRSKMLSRLSEIRKPTTSYSSLASEAEQKTSEMSIPIPPAMMAADNTASQPGQAPRLNPSSRKGEIPDRDGSKLLKCRDFADQSPPGDYGISRFPFPLISLQEAALRYSQQRDRPEDYNDAAPTFPKSATISTVSSYSARTPVTPVRDARGINGLSKPPPAYHRNTSARQHLRESPP
jgi:hypothetical protein